ncbi:hypothetical protein FRC03_010038 [Tulasnella sp. 419]|nr:hypothetical protein FRC03_010038 [Tulasnella sp. 419]
MISSAVAITPLERLNRSQTPIPLFIFAFELIAFLHSNLLTVHYLAQFSFKSLAVLCCSPHNFQNVLLFGSNSCRTLNMPNISPTLVAVVGFLVFFVANIHRIVTNPPPIGFIILGSYRHRLDFADFVAAFVIISLTVAQAFLLGQQRQANTTNPQVGPADQARRRGRVSRDRCCLNHERLRDDEAVVFRTVESNFGYIFLHFLYPSLNVSITTPVKKGPALFVIVYVSLEHTSM